MKPKFNIYEIVCNQVYNGWISKTFHTFEYLNSFNDLESAENWLKENQKRWVRYTIIPEYFTNGFED